VVLVYIKKILLFILALVFVFVLMELFIYKVIHYPRYGVEKKIYRSVKYNQKAKIYLPYSEYWTVEGGNKVYKRNNIGLPGIDIELNSDTKYIFVLGASYTESLSNQPDSMFTSRFQKLLLNDNENVGVLNLGYAGFTVYEDYYRAAYFERYCKPEKVFLIIHAIYENFEIEEDNFKMSSDFGETVNTFSIMFSKPYLNSSSFLYLLASAVQKDNDIIVERNIKIDTTISGMDETRRNSLIRLELCLKAFKKKYGNDFIFVSIMNEKNNEDLRIISNNAGVNFISKDLLTDPDLRINGTGHLNTKGSKILSEILYEAYYKFDKK
jgi:hypothetical protein